MRRGFVAALIVLFAQPVFAAGTLTYPQFFSTSLQQTRTLGVYVPEGYNPGGQIHYPVIYFLHGAYQNQTSNWGVLKPTLDTMIAAGQLFPVIVVEPDGSGGAFGGSFWANSALYGPFEDYVVEDVVNYMDASYLTFADHRMRALMGYSDGGDGAMAASLRHPDVFGAVAAHSGFFNWDRAREALRDCTLSENSGPPYNYVPTAGECTDAVFRVGGAYSPNLQNPPYFVDFLYDQAGTVVESVMARWKLFNADVLAAAIPPNSRPKVYFDCGTQDTFNYPGNLDLTASLDAMGFPHVFWSFAGGHALTQTRLQHSLGFLDTSLMDPADVEDYPVHVGSAPRLYPNEPNPVHGSTTIRFDVPSSETASLRIFDTAGRSVETLVNNGVSVGVHSVRWNPRGLPNGTYFYELRTREGRTSRKLVVAQ